MILYDKKYELETTPRTNKGESLNQWCDDYCVIDIETTGLLAKYDEIIELGAIKIRNNEIVDSFSQLIKPEAQISDFIYELTGISNEMVKDKKSIKYVLPDFLNFIGSDIVVGHNIAVFDTNFIYDACIEFSCKKFSNDFIDTLKFSRRIYPEFHCHTMNYLIEKLNIPCDNQHRAYDDCHSSYELYKKLKYHALKNNIDISKPLSHKKAKDIKTDVTLFDEEHILFGKNVVITGTLKVPRTTAFQIIADLGGICQDNIKKNTDYLVEGLTDYKKVICGKSRKHKLAETNILKGLNIKIIPETVFYDMINS